MKREPVWRAVWEQLYLQSQLTCQQLLCRVKPMYTERGTAQPWADMSWWRYSPWGSLDTHSSLFLQCLLGTSAGWLRAGARPSHLPPGHPEPPCCPTWSLAGSVGTCVIAVPSSCCEAWPKTSLPLWSSLVPASQGVLPALPFCTFRTISKWWNKETRHLDILFFCLFVFCFCFDFLFCILYFMLLNCFSCSLFAYPSNCQQNKVK